MKQQPLTYKIKEALSAHFKNGGTVSNVPDDLARVSIQDRQRCFEFWKSKNKPPRP